MANSNSGGLWKVAGTILVIISMAAGIIVAFTNVDNRTAQNTKDIEVLVPQVNKNTEHRLQDERDTQYIREKLEDIDVKIAALLQEMRK